MAFTGNFTTNTFKTGLLDGVFNFNTGTSQVYNIALYTNAATLNADTTAYTSTGEASGGNYSAGGQVLVVSQIPTIVTRQVWQQPIYLLQTPHGQAQSPQEVH